MFVSGSTFGAIRIDFGDVKLILTCLIALV